MSNVFANLVQETTTTGGIGPLTLLGPVQGFQPISKIGVGNSAMFAIREVNLLGLPTGAFEIANCTYTTGTLTRNTVEDSSNGGALVGFSSGTTKTIELIQSAGQIAALNTPIVPTVEPVSPPVESQIGYSISRSGQMLGLGASGSFSEGAVEAPCVFYDELERCWVMVHTGYTAGLTTASIGLATAPDPAGPWTQDARSPILSGSGVSGGPDQGGCTGPVIWRENGLYYMFYIGLTTSGYEAGTRSMCLARASSVGGPWTRLGAVIVPQGSGFCATSIWHASIVKNGTTYYNFFNATGTLNGNSTERIGYATAPAITGPWTVQGLLLDVPGGTSAWDSKQVGDPCVYKIGNLWYMAYYGVNSTTGLASDGLAITTDANFPNGWTRDTRYSPVISADGSNTLDSQYAHKPWILNVGGAHYHYYTAVGPAGRVIALASTLPRSVEFYKVNDPISAQSVTANSFTNIPQSSIFFDATDKRCVEARLFVRGNAQGASGTFRLANAGVSCSLTGSGYANVHGPWTPVPSAEGAIFYDYVQYKSDNGSTAVLYGGCGVEFRFHESGSEIISTPAPAPSPAPGPSPAPAGTHYLDNTAGTGGAFTALTAAMIPQNNTFVVTGLVRLNALVQSDIQAILNNFTSAPDQTNSTFIFYVDTAGNLKLTYVTSTGSFIEAASTVGLPSAAVSGPLYVQVTVNPAANKFAFATSTPDSSLNETTYTALGTTVTGHDSNGNAVSAAPTANPPLSGAQIATGGRVGASGSKLIGRIYRTKLVINGATASDLDFRNATPGAGPVADAQGNSWTLAGSSPVV